MFAFWYKNLDYKPQSINQSITRYTITFNYSYFIYYYLQDSIVVVTLPSQLTYIVEHSCKLSADIQRCRLPVVQTSSCMYKAGLCAVLRSVVKQASTTCKDLHSLLVRQRSTSVIYILLFIRSFILYCATYRRHC